METKVLIVDDEELILMGWKHTLKTAGYNVMTASNGKDAIKCVHSDRPDIVITDLIMSEMNGIEVCKEIKKTTPQTEVVLVSGHLDETKKYYNDFLKAGGRKEILRKPLSKEEILMALDKIMGEKATDI